MNVPALLATLFFAAVLLLVFAFLYAIALRSHREGELGDDGLALLRWALAGQMLLYALIGATAFLS